MQVGLKVIKGKQLGQFVLLAEGEFMFGRGPECEICPNSDLVSRQHCLLQVSHAGAVIRDLGSCNGTLVNGQLVVGDRTLENGDALQLGPVVLEVVMDTSMVDTALANHQDPTRRGDALAAPAMRQR